MYAARGSLSSFLPTLVLLLFLSLALLPTIFVSLRFRSCSRSFRSLSLEIALSSDSHAQLANHFLLRKPASALVRLSVFLCSSAPPLLLCSSYSASSALSSLPLLRGNLSLQRVSRSKLQPRTEQIHFCVIQRYVLRAFDINATTFFYVPGNCFTRFCS